MRRPLLRRAVYVAVGIPLGVAYLVLLGGGLAVGVVLGPLYVGLPLLLGATELAWRCASFERVLANRLLGARIPPLPPLPPDTGGGALHRVNVRLRAGSLWRGLAMLLVRLPSDLVAIALSALALALCVALAVLGIGGISGARTGYVGPFSLGVALGLVLCALALPAAVVTFAVANALTLLLRTLARGLLLTRTPPGGPVRETLAESLGDHTLSIAYWLPDRRTFVDERGHPVALPLPASGRAWTSVDYDGRRVAAIIHDVNIDASPELVQAAAAAASLAIENERLKADLRARVQELRASRVRIVEAGDSARRRLERDLHDGAQQQLVALAVDLRILRARVSANAQAAELMDSIDEKLTAALAELRELARGIHPAILTDRGLVPALQALADRAGIPVRCELEVPARVAPAVEAAAYFVVAEALTNVLKYAQAESVTVRARRDGGDIVVETEDDGVGGAEGRWGSGLRGLDDRVGALDGALSVRSPRGGGTLVRARIPCREGGPAAAGRH